MKNSCKQVHGREVNLEDCPVVEASKYLGDFWNLWILRRLHKGSARFGELIEAMPKINKMTLSAKLKELERVGLIERQEVASRGVEYSLTSMGRGTSSVLSSVETFAHEYF